MKRSHRALLLLSFVSFGTSIAFAAAPAPFGIDKRPLPPKEDEETLLPANVGSFKRDAVEGRLKTDDEVYSTYKSGKREVLLTAGVNDDVADAQDGVETAKEVLNESAETPYKAPIESLKSDPAFFQVVEGDTAFIAWSHGKYFFTVDSSDGDKEALEEFIKAFPY